MPHPPRETFQIGWICALPIEIAAAKEMLDENFGILDKQDANDTNSYLLGRIGEHYVVIAGLGQYGTTSATSVAINMMRTFSQSLRIGLMVGIGAGIPSDNHDIRLGDIVVSYPDGTCGGVLQYDLGKIVEGGKLMRIGSLNSPPRSLLTALAHLRAATLTDDPKYPKYIEKAIVRNSRTMRIFGRPNVSTDRLFRVQHEHPSSASTCESCLGEWEQSREIREESYAQIHYGVVASGNAVIKDGEKRELLRKETGALCFEMEAAGLMMDFPCIVVRGICDYADSHKNDSWQGYAALAAASYVKELLGYVPVGLVSQEKRVTEICHEIFDGVETLNRGVERVFKQREVHHRETVVRNNNREREECHQTFKTSTYEQYKNINPNRVEGTCRWFLENPQYDQWWKSSHNDLLWISADPGCGKSVLAKSLVDVELKKSASVSICYFFFKDNEDQNSLTAALCAILHQLFGFQPDLLHHALPEWKKNREKIQREADILWRIFEAAISDEAFSSTICVLDGLDECRSSDQTELIQRLADFRSRSHSLPRRNWLKFLVTSRPYIEIQEGFRLATESFPQIHIRGEEENDQIRLEINHIVKIRVRELGQIEGLKPQTLQRIEKQLLRMDHRTYLWLHLVMEDIRIILRDSLHPEEEMIQLIPSSVEAAYEKILNRVPPGKEPVVKMIFQLIVGARRPLTIEELSIALGIASSKSLDSRSVASAGLELEGFDGKIRHLCGLFVFINSSKRVFLIHQTAREFLVNDMNVTLTERLSNISATHRRRYAEDIVQREASDRDRKWYHITQMQASFLIFKTCLLYLSAEEFQNGRLVVDRRNEDGYLIETLFWDRNKNLSQHPFLKYSVEEWKNHAITSCSTKTKDLVDLAMKLKIAPTLRDAWLLVTVQQGHDEAVKLLLKNGADVNVQDKQGMSPLMWAAQKKHKQLVEILIENGADVNIQDTSGQRLLSRAVEERQTEIAMLLLKNGAHTETRGFRDRTPLWVAASERQTDIVKVLVEMGADVEAKDNMGKTPLHQASCCNHKSIVELLFKLGANIEAKDDMGITPLYQAIRCNRISMACLLVNLGADIRARDSTGITPLHLACSYNHYPGPMVYRLIKLGADIEAKDSNGMTPLHQASRCGHGYAATVLVIMRADIEAKDNMGMTPLHQASSYDHGFTGEMLVKLGADLEAKDSTGMTPLHKASRYGHTFAADMLFKLGADIKAKDDTGMTPLHQASSHDHRSTAKMLVKLGASIEAKDNNGMTPLHQACRYGYTYTARGLVKLGADIKAKDNLGMTPLHQACRYGHRSIAYPLFKLGADIEARDNNGMTPLHHASCHDQGSTVKMLVTLGADIKAKDNIGMTPLRHAVKLAQDEMVMLLRRLGADKAEDEDSTGRILS